MKHIERKRKEVIIAYRVNNSVTKNRCVTHVKIRGYANFVSSLLAYLISTVVS